ncbi:MAG: hypothetical protein PHP50_08070 [Lachnospiraceae bacterium]|nr:hypothetical protein [Lachnospiraceae bacterium]
MNKLQQKFYEPFYIDEAKLDQFIELNRKYWDKNAVTKKSDKFIYINFMMIHKEIDLMLPKLIYAKGLEQTTGAKPVVLDWNDNEKLRALYDSFGIGYISIRKKMMRHPVSIMKCLGKIMGYYCGNLSGEELKKMKIHGIPVGLHLYEDIIRTSELSTIRTVRDKVCMKKLFSLMLFTEEIELICQKGKPELCLSDDFPYNEGIILSIMQNSGAKVVQAGMKRDRMISYNGTECSSYKHHYLHRYVEEHIKRAETEDYQPWVEQFLQDRFHGKLGPVIDRVAYLNKNVCTREELAEKTGLDPNKKNVIIMTHVFSDATFQSGDNCFRDNYDWTEKTLEFAKNHDEVNWLIKPHPARKSYADSKDSVEMMIERNQSPNIYVFPDEFSTESILNVADVLVTVCGTAGMEYTCFGIPVIALGDAFYNGFGFTYHPTTKEAYFDLLSKAGELSPLTEEQKIMARKVVYTYGKLSDGFLDEFDEAVYTDYQQMQDEMRQNHGDKTAYSNCNTRSLDLFETKLREDKIKELAYYEGGKKRV